MTYRSGDTAGKSLLLASVVWIRNEAVVLLLYTRVSFLFVLHEHSHYILDNGKNVPVKTNCPTVAANPDKKALNGCMYGSC